MTSQHFLLLKLKIDFKYHCNITICVEEGLHAFNLAASLHCIPSAMKSVYISKCKNK